MQPLVSCVLPTANRRSFLKQTIKYFMRQTYPQKELIIIDDGEDSSGDVVPSHDQITYIRLNQHIALGTKLNLGIERASGTIIQKWDDDDYYHPNFLATNIATLLMHSTEDCVVCHDRFLVFLAATAELKITDPGWCAGSTLCFFQQLWQKAGFRPLECAVDWHFLEDHAPVRCGVSDPELHMVVRHKRHTWTKLGSLDVDEYMRRLPNYHRSLEELMEVDDVRFYQHLAQECLAI